jgi:hypothetical protein
MAVSLKHAFSSGKADGTDATLVQPSNWNSEHNLTVSAPSVLGKLLTFGSTARSITAVTKANPGVLTATSFDMVAGQLVTISGVGGMTQLNGNTYVVLNPSGSTFNIAALATPTTAIDTTSYTTYTSGGTVTPTGTALADQLSFTGTGSSTAKIVLDATPSITNPTVTNYSEAGVTTSGTSLSVDLASGTFWRFTISGGNASMSITGGGAGKSFILILTQDSTPRTMTWPVNVVWPSGTAPTLSTGSGKRDIFSFFYDPTTPSWLATTVGQNY